MHRTRVKICGITRAQDLLDAASAGADAVGLVFYEASPRGLSVAQARDLLQHLPPFVASVALFVDPQASLVEQVLDEMRPSMLQFHGDESPGFCESFGTPYLKALHLPRAGESAVSALAVRAALERQMDAHARATGFLLDTLSGKGRGGTGEVFDHSFWPSGCARPLVLAGGLDPGNVAAAIKACRPFAVDVSSGVEQAPGVKDAAAIENFVSAVQSTSMNLKD